MRALSLSLCLSVCLSPYWYHVLYVDDVDVDVRYLIRTLPKVGGDEVAMKQWSRSTVARDFMASHRLRRVEGIAGVMMQNVAGSIWRFREIWKGWCYKVLHTLMYKIV